MTRGRRRQDGLALVRAEKVQELTDQIARLEKEAEASNAEFARHHKALEELMRAVLQEACGPFAFTTSIASGRLIAAVETASRTIHDRREQA